MRFENGQCPGNLAQRRQLLTLRHVLPDIVVDPFAIMAQLLRS